MCYQHKAHIWILDTRLLNGVSGMEWAIIWVTLMMISVLWPFEYGHSTHTQIKRLPAPKWWFIVLTFESYHLSFFPINVQEELTIPTSWVEGPKVYTIQYPFACDPINWNSESWNVTSTINRSTKLIFPPLELVTFRSAKEQPCNCTKTLFLF